MKSLKAAVVVAGSVVLAGVAAPAFAAPADLTPTSLNGAVDTLARGPINVEDAMCTSVSRMAANRRRCCSMRSLRSRSLSCRRTGHG